IASQSAVRVAYCVDEKYFGEYFPAGAEAFSLRTTWCAYSAAFAGITCSTDPPAAPIAKVLKMSRRLIPACAISDPFLTRLTGYRLPFLTSSSKYSEARQESAMIVSVGFLSGLVTSDAPSVRKRFFTSCDWQYEFNTEVFGSAPIRAVPTS